MKKFESRNHSVFIQHTLINYVPTINFNKKGCKTLM